MKRLVGVGVLSTALICMNITMASAGCSYGAQSLGGSINAGQLDGDRFFTSDGGRITISISANNGPLEVSIPGCGTRTGKYYSCTTTTGRGEEVHPNIYNPNDFTVTYTFRCHG